MFNFLIYLVFLISPQELLQNIDKMRNPHESYRVFVKLTTESQDFYLDVFVKGKDKSLVRFTSPARWKGRILLLNGPNMWFYTPNSKPIRIAPIHRLIGGFSNADIASVYFSIDYEPLKLSEQDGKYFLELKRRSKGAAYGRIELLIDKSNFHIIKGNFYALSGRFLKEVYYLDYKLVDGNECYTKLEVIDKVNDNERTTMEFLRLKKEHFPDRIFNKDFLPYFK